jgi:hypothetical protein
MAIVTEPEDFDGPKAWIDEPIPPHPKRGVLCELLDAIAAAIARRRGDDLNHDIRRDRRGAVARELAALGEEHRDVWLATAASAHGELRIGTEYSSPSLPSPSTEDQKEPTDDDLMGKIRHFVLYEPAVHELSRLIFR